MNKKFKKLLAVMAMVPSLMMTVACDNGGNPPTTLPGEPEATITHTEPRYTNVAGVTLVEDSDYWHDDFQGKYTKNNIHLPQAWYLQKSPLIYINGIGYEYSQIGTSEDYRVMEWNLGMGHEIVDIEEGSNHGIIARKDNGDLVLYRGTPDYDNNVYNIDSAFKLPCTQQEYRFLDDTYLYFVRNNTLYFTEIWVGGGSYNTPEVLYYKSGENVVKITEMHIGYNNKIAFETEEGKAYRWQNHDTETVPGKRLINALYEIPNIDRFITVITGPGYYSVVTIPDDSNTLYVYISDMGEDWYDEGKIFELPAGYDIDDVEKFYNHNSDDLIVKLNNGKYYRICYNDINDYNASVFHMEEITALSALEEAGNVENIFGNCHYHSDDDKLYVVMDDQNLYSIEHD